VFCTFTVHCSAKEQSGKATPPIIAVTAAKTMTNREIADGTPESKVALNGDVANEVIKNQSAFK